MQNWRAGFGNLAEMLIQCHNLIKGILDQIFIKNPNFQDCFGFPDQYFAPLPKGPAGFHGNP